MQFYAGMADAAAARLFALRVENRNAARAGVRAREHFIRAKTLDASSPMRTWASASTTTTWTHSAPWPEFCDFHGYPGGSKQEGVRLLEHAIADGVLTSSLARFYLA